MTTFITTIVTITIIVLIIVISEILIIMITTLGSVDALSHLGTKELELMLTEHRPLSGNKQFQKVKLELRYHLTLPACCRVGIIIELLFCPTIEKQ